MTQIPSRLIAALLLSTATLAASAASITPTYTTFSNLAGATYGGSGIPTDPSAITKVETLTLGMAATQRFVGPNLLNDGAGTYFANAGTNNVPPRATWNFNYYINDSQNRLDGNGLTYKLLYDFDPGVGTDESQMGILDFTSFLGVSGSTLQNSQNLTFAFLSTPSFFITPPAGAFDPNASGEYSFALIASRGTTEVGRSAINVVVSAVPEPSSIALMGLALLGMVGARKRRQLRK